MAGVPAGLPAGVRVSDHISLGEIAKTFPPGRVQQVLAETGKASARERDLPAQVMVYYAIAMALYMGSSTREVLRCLLEGLRWLWGADAVKVAGKSGISQARSRLGEMPLRRLYEQIVQPVATRATQGAWYRGWRLVSLDGSSLDVADTAENGIAFGYPGASRGESAFPQLRFVALVENGTHVLFGARLGEDGQGSTDASPWNAIGGAPWTAKRRCPPLPFHRLCRWTLRQLRPRRGAGTPAGHAVPGRPAVLRACALASRNCHRRRPAVAGKEQPAAATRDGAGGRVLSNDDRSEREGSAPRGQRRAGARGRIPPRRRGECRAALPAGDYDLGPGASACRGLDRALPRALGDRGRWPS